MVQYIDIVSSVCEGWDKMLEQAGGGGGGGGGGRMGPVFSTLAGAEEEGDGAAEVRGQRSRGPGD
jgi:hypothetical protein